MSGKKIIDGLNEVIAELRSGGEMTLVDELRESCGGLCEHEKYGCLRCKAADEIERLRAANEALEIMEATGRREATGFIAEIERLRAALREIADDPRTNLSIDGVNHMKMIARAALTEGGKWRDLVERLRDQYRLDWAIEDRYAAADEIERLKSALRGIYDRYIINDDSGICADAMFDIARAALKEGE